MSDTKTTTGLNRNSHHITDGDERAPNRSMLRAVGFGDKDFGKPILGVASAQSDITPCNLGLGELAVEASRGIREAGYVSVEIDPAGYRGPSL